MTDYTFRGARCKMIVDLVVSKHPALLDVLRERGFASEGTLQVEQVTNPDQLVGAIVAGDGLPLPVAAACAMVVDVTLHLTDAERTSGTPVPLTRLREAAGDLRFYRVHGGALPPWNDLKVSFSVHVALINSSPVEVIARVREGSDTRRLADIFAQEGMTITGRGTDFLMIRLERAHICYLEQSSDIEWVSTLSRHRVPQAERR